MAQIAGDHGNADSRDHINGPDEGARDDPPPVPSKDDSPPSSPGSVSSASTARPVTPPPLIGDPVAQQLSDMSRLLSTVVGQNSDILQKVARRQAELSPRGTSLRRLEDLMHRTLLRLGEQELATELEAGMESSYNEARSITPSLGTLTEADWHHEGSIYTGTEASYSQDWHLENRSPANSLAETYARHRRGGSAGDVESLFDVDIRDPDFGEKSAIQSISFDTPPPEYAVPHVRVPSQIARHPRGPPAAHADGKPPESGHNDHPDHVTDGSQDEVRQEQNETPIPYRPEEQHEREMSEYDSDAVNRGASRRLPPPQPVDLPTPVRSPGAYPQLQTGPSYSTGVPPPLPGMGSIPRPSLPRIAGARDPISTT